MIHLRCSIGIKDAEESPPPIAVFPLEDLEGDNERINHGSPESDTEYNREEAHELSGSNALNMITRRVEEFQNYNIFIYMRYLLLLQFQIIISSSLLPIL